MKKEFVNKTSINDHLGCFGNFNLEDSICKKFCALSLRCAIDRERDIRLELMEDLMSSDCMLIKIQ
ncbi:MAG: hypothetical protein V3S16_04405 [Candidatus Desulfatibia sp.]|uniref:hypothetical protein n=1 Tax=Candidatus Desulfatibia sp. TaxID=3101189 RepID=UPI002F34C139